MLGACLLTEHAPGLEEMFDCESEIEIYRTAKEMVEKIAILKGDKERRARMRRSAQARALSDHSLPRTLGRIAEFLGLPVAGK